jgi:hypothetical protein
MTLGCSGVTVSCRKFRKKQVFSGKNYNEEYIKKKKTETARNRAGTYIRGFLGVGKGTRRRRKKKDERRKE